ncbi:hypothetical protein MTR67_035388, partial [Solanum verrucosum]
LGWCVDAGKECYSLCFQMKSATCVESKRSKFEIEKMDGISQGLRCDYSVSSKEVRVDYNSQQLTKIYVKEIVRSHVVPLSTISDRGTQFTSKFLGTLHEVLGTQLTFSIAFHPQTGGSLVKGKGIQAKLLAAQSTEKEYLDRNVRDMTFRVGEQILLKVSPMKGVLRFDNKGNLRPYYISLLDVLDGMGLVAYMLALPPNFLEVHPIFHVCMWGLYHQMGLNSVTQGLAV